MGLKQYREYRTSEPANTDVLEDFPHKIITEELIPRMVRKNRNAVNVDRRDFYFYAKKRSGRRCSCHSFETEPDGTCKICFQTGNVGGYDKYGCITEIGDITYPNLRTFNVRGAYELQHRPILMALDENTTYGFIEFDVTVINNVKKVDLTQLHVSVKDKKRSSAKAFIKSNLNPSWLPFNDTNLGINLYAKNFTIKIELKRNNSGIESPLLSHLLLRYRLLKDHVIPVDIPKRRESVIMQEWGIIDNWENITMACSDKPRRVQVEDIFVHAVDGTKWKVVDVNRFDPAGQLVGHDMNCRIINSKDATFGIPV